MKKETSFRKITKLPDTTPKSLVEPKEEDQATNNPPSKGQEETNKQTSFAGELNIRIPKSLYSSLNNQAEEEGVSLTEYILYKLSI